MRCYQGKMRWDRRPEKVRVVHCFAPPCHAPRISIKQAFALLLLLNLFCLLKPTAPWQLGAAQKMGRERLWRQCLFEIVIRYFPAPLLGRGDLSSHFMILCKVLSLGYNLFSMLTQLRLLLGDFNSVICLARRSLPFS